MSSRTKAKPAKQATPRAAKRAAAAKSAEAKLAEVKRRLLEVSDLGSAASVLSWDQATYMPTGGAAARAPGRRPERSGAREGHRSGARQAARCSGPYAESLPGDSDDACLIRVARRDFDKAVKVPAEFVARWSQYGSASYDAWTRARPANDFATMRPLLEQALDFSRAYADFFAPYAHIADPLIDGPDEGMTTASVLALFTELRAELVPIVRAITAQPAADGWCLQGRVPGSRADRVRPRRGPRFGYDLERGRLDKTHHPFCTKFSGGDVRITTRVREDDIGEALFSTLHEAGHALYEQGVSRRLEGTPLGYGASAGVHESQSRLWENMVGRSRGFWEYFYPALRKAFPDQFGRVPLDAFYRAINKVERSLIRTDADEVTYNLHVMMRFDLELDLLEGRLAVEDLPEAWRARFRPTSASRRPTTATAACRTCTGTAARSAALPGLHHRQHPERAVLRRGAAGAPEIPPRSPRASLPRCTAGCARTSIPTGASSRPTSWSSAPPARP